MSGTSLFPAIARQQFFTDHSVASITAPERAQRQPETVPATNTSTSGDERRQHDVSMTNIKSLYPVFNRAMSSRFNDVGDGWTGGTASRQITTSSSVSISTHVDRLTTDCQSNYLYQPWCSEKKNSEDDMNVIQSVPHSVEFQEAGLGTSAFNIQTDGVQGDDGGHETMTPAGSMLHPTPMFPRSSPALPSSVTFETPQLELEFADLWRRFDELTTEMVITKSGRSVGL